MATSGTSIYAAKVAVKAMLEAHTWPGTTPTITWGSPTEKEDVTAEMVYMRDVQVDEDFVSLGAGRMDETFALPIVVDVIKYGDDEQATEQRAWQLRDEIVALLQADMTLGGAVNRISGFRVRPANVPYTQTWQTQIVIEPLCVGFEWFT